MKSRNKNYKLDANKDSSSESQFQTINIPNNSNNVNNNFSTFPMQGVQQFNPMLNNLQNGQMIPGMQNVNNIMSNLNSFPNASMNSGPQNLNQMMSNINNLPNSQMQGLQNMNQVQMMNNLANGQIQGVQNINPNSMINDDPASKPLTNGMIGMNVNNINQNNPNMPGVNPSMINPNLANQIPLGPLNPNMNLPALNSNMPPQLINPNGILIPIPPLNVLKENYFDARINARYDKIFRKLENNKEKSNNKNNQKPNMPLDIPIPLSELFKMAFDYKLIEKSVIIGSIHKKEKSNSNRDDYTYLNKNPQSLIFKAHSNINPKVNLMIIDKSLVLTVKNQATKNACIKISKLESFKHNSDKICLALYIVTRLTETETQETFNTIQEKLLNDYFKSFVENQNYKKFPIFYSKAFAGKILAGTYFNELLKARMHLFEKEYEIIIKQIKVSKTEIDFKDFVKARLFVSSRNMNIVNRQGENLSAIPILIDQIKRTNDPDRANCNFDYKGGKFYLISTKKISKGEELQILNPKISNSDSLMNLGYTIPSNHKISEVYLYIKINSNKELAEESPIQKDEIGILLQGNFNLNEVLKSFRLMQANFIKSENQDDENIGPQSVDNEILALHVFRKSLRTKILKYPTNLESDMVIMKYKNLSENELNLYRIVIEEKYIVVFYFNMASFFEKFITKIKNAQNVDDKMVEKITKDKFYKYYYDQIKNLLKDFIKDQTFIPENSGFVINPNVDGNTEFSVDDMDEEDIHELEKEEFEIEEDDDEEED